MSGTDMKVDTRNGEKRESERKIRITLGIMG